jgi:transposase InsO family protein
MEYIALGLKRDTALEIAGITKHQYYHKPKNGQRGAPASIYTQRHIGNNKIKVSNTEVVERIKTIHSEPDIGYGYQKMTVALKILGFYINHKKVYRLMKENQLLRQKSKKAKRKFVKYRIVYPEGPLHLLEMDIKFVWIESARQHGYILTVIDVFTRQVLGWFAGMNITQHTVKAIWEEIIINHLQPNDMLNKGIHIEVRNDNDKRFSAKMVQHFFKENYLDQVFTHPYTPQENGHIESFHAILGRSLDKCHFETIDDLNLHLHLFYDRYNNRRLHGSIANLPPIVFKEQWDNYNIMRCVDKENKKVKFKLMIPYRQITISGNKNLSAASCLIGDSLDGKQQSSKVSDVTTIQPSVQKSPAAASC